MRLIDADALKFPALKVQFDDAGLAKIDGYHMAIEVVRNAPHHRCCAGGAVQGL